MNALNHAFERLLSPGHQPIADAQFLHALRRSCRACAGWVVGTADQEALTACILGAQPVGVDQRPGGIGHAIAHVLGAATGSATAWPTGS